jgi:hypothetical protein
LCLLLCNYHAVSDTLALLYNLNSSEMSLPYYVLSSTFALTFPSIPNLPSELLFFISRQKVPKLKIKSLLEQGRNV